MRRIFAATVSVALLLGMSASPVAADTLSWFGNPIVDSTASFTTTATGLVVAQVVLNEGDGLRLTLTGPTVCQAHRCDKHHPPTTYSCTVETTQQYVGAGCGFSQGPAGVWTIHYYALSSAYTNGWVDFTADYWADPWDG